MAKGNNALLIFDFDQTITNAHMHNTFRWLGKVDFNPTQSNAVTDADIRKFIEDKGGIKNEKELKPVLQFAISKGIEVNIASYTGYPNAVRRVIKNHLGLSEKQAENISVFCGFPQDYDTRLQGSVEKQKSEVGKNLHICKAIVEYKDKHGQLPKTVMLVDDDITNIKKIKEFVVSMSKREGWLKENGLNIKDINNIEFEGVKVPKEKNSKIVEGVDYLKKVQEFISPNLVQEPIYENSKKEEPIYQNLQDIKRSSFQEKPLQLPPKKRKLNKVHTDSGVAVNGKNEEQIYTQNISVPVVKETEVHFPYCSKLYLETPMQRLRDSLQKDHFSKEAIDVICSLFKEKVISAIREQGDRVIEKSEVFYTESRHHYNNDSKITDDSFTHIMAQVEEKKKEIKDFASEDPQLRKKNIRVIKC
ncbi:hypothetical protein [Wolbachia endosymbiont (group A) of Icerya purchasi]|uniref:hypothetical protein n=1 Tax=Wolbachia endosymbiont (group A) of Icerya purchasi TaxID=2954019 RepID=UPI00222F66CF|nr:hypothetical protein [Wolbachia endosymbiont (group A) of Icerya purchasi]